MTLSDSDRAAIAAAVTAAEATSDGEIVTVMAARSDDYHDVGLHWSVLAMLLVPALLALRPSILASLHARLFDPWAQQVPTGQALAIALVLLVVAFLVVRFALAWMPLRMALTPGTTKSRRVRRRAIACFRLTVDRRTRASTGVLLYLSLAERRAEIVADEGIHAKVAPDTWGETMAELIGRIRDGEPGEGMVRAVARIGAVLAEHFPRDDTDTNELPDRLIEL